MNYEVENFICSNSYAYNMNEYVKKNKIKNYGFEEELKELIKGLSRFKKNNVLLIGKAGVGKTALVEKLCEMINSNKVPIILQNKTILNISLSGVVAGTRYRGSMEEKLQKLLDFVTNRDDIIVFVDEIHNFLKAGKSEGALSVSDILKPYLARNDFSLIGATTIDEFNETIAKDSAVLRRFYKVDLEEPSLEKTITILEKAKMDYEKHYSIKLTKKDIQKIVELAKNNSGSFPDKAFDVLEEYCYMKANEKKNQYVSDDNL